MQINYFFKKIVDVFFPDTCVGCGLKDSLLCDVCKKRLLSASSAEHSFITSIFSYKDPFVKRLIWLLKYKNAKRVTGIFAPYIASSMLEFLGEEKLFIGESEILLVPIPLSRKRYKKRGYNQSEVLAREIERILSKENSLKNIRTETKLVSKIKDTIPQAGIKKRSIRLSNQNDCFEILPHSLSRKEIILLVDDVTTTGATLSVIRKILQKEGFRKVYAFTIAH